MNKWINKGILALFAFFAVFSTLAIDVKFTRYKLFAMEFPLILIAALWILKMANEGEFRVRKSILNLPVLSYSILTVLSYVISTDKAVANAALETAIFCLLAFFVTANTLRENRTRRTVLLFWYGASAFVALHGLGAYLAVSNPYNPITAAFSGLAGLFDSLDKTTKLPLRNFFGFAHFSPNPRPFATFGNANFFASYLVAVIPVFTSTLFVLKKKLLALNLAVLLLLVINLFATGTRGAWIGFAVSAVLFAVLVRRSEATGKIFRSKKQLAILCIMLAVTAGVFFKTDLYRTTVQVIKRPTERLLIWRDTLVMSVKRPLGVGIGAYHIYFPGFASEELTNKLPQDRFIVNYAHNEFLQVLSETGFVGFALFMWLIYAFFKSCVLRMKASRGKDRQAYYINAGCLAGGAGILADSFFSVSMRFIVTSIYLYFLMGMSVSMEQEGTVIYDGLKNASKKKPYLFAVAALLLISCWLSTRVIIRPFTAHRQLTEEVGFFDQKVASPEDTIKLLRKGIEADPENANLYYKLAWVYAKQKQWAEAIKYFELTSSIDPKLEGPYNNLGNIYYMIGNKEKAIENYRKSIQINPDKVDAHFNLGYIYYNSGKLKEASNEFKKILELDPKNYKATIMLEKMVQ